MPETPENELLASCLKPQERSWVDLIMRSLGLESFARQIKRVAVRRYQESALGWHLRTLRPQLEYRFSGPRVKGAASRVVRDLIRDGIASINVDELVDPALTENLADEVSRLQDAHVDEILNVRAGQGNGAGNKSHYRVHYLGDKPEFDSESIFARFALSPGVLSIANAYYGLEAKLRHYNVWHTFPAGGDPSDSQLWHRDQEDRYVLKVFLYLDDVDRDSGPLTYIPGSHRKGSLRVQPRAFKEPGHGNLRTRDDQMEQVVRRTSWREALGRRGTLVFVDTAGYHKGGFSRSKERLVYTCMFTSPASPVGDLFSDGGVR